MGIFNTFIKQFFPRYVEKKKLNELFYKFYVFDLKTKCAKNGKLTFFGKSKAAAMLIINYLKVKYNINKLSGGLLKPHGSPTHRLEKELHLDFNTSNKIVNSKSDKTDNTRMPKFVTRENYKAFRYSIPTDYKKYEKIMSKHCVKHYEK